MADEPTLGHLLYGEGLLPYVRDAGEEHFEIA